MLTIDGTTVRMLDFSALPDEVGGKMQRALSGERRGGTLWRARGWSGTAYCATSADEAALRVLADGETPRTCAGDLLPSGGVVCHVEMGQVGFLRKADGTAYQTPALTFRKVAPE